MQSIFTNYIMKYITNTTLSRNYDRCLIKLVSR